ncbi:dihydrolipoamide acetyltransferase [Alteromonas macleodii str. 'Black Sea 11']|nr:dihydrolipoamide acetyltransferase [Alteromonas macleodii str. 'Black Sea 11']NKW89565.1 dihydrolipoyllysine-residue acetyltransferase [Alteromonadaceae bacterium A_SAG4]NKX04225.1 dihydrolipoyllysine-residue acetyltransferase [Alteromonadaceae bacterium A_SAG6]NKX18548.1 dihydrolipoyllysine-residue acetyltransferase [Alteromonadaceae bacterium A_SAG5]NKX35044.1 dihydrolipoyllysine-residue acetyltransferase [Alteromonadaceae bacterium A_SAG3]
MTIEFILPDIGEGIVECELLEWLVSEGEHIEEDQPVAEVMTDKATVQIPAMHAGVVNKLHYAVGDIAKVHAPLFSMTPDDADANSDTQEDAQAEVKDNAAEAATANDSASSSASNGKHIEDFILPDIGEGIVECEIVKWNVAEGDEIEEDQAVVEVMTDKAVVEIPAKNAGTVHRLYYAQGDIAKVHSALFALEVDGEASATNSTADAPPSSHTGSSNVASQSSVQTQTNGLSPQSTQVAPSKFSDGEYEPPIAIEGKVLASPAVRRVAREKNIDLSSVKGSGKKGRILKSDVLNLQQPSVGSSTQSAPSSSSSSTSQKGDSSSVNTVVKGSVRTEKVRGIQAAMAKQMSASVYTIPHFTVSDELVMDNLMSLRKLLKPEFEAKNVKLSFMPFFVKAMSLALNEFPVVNSQLNEDATEISYFADHNIGFAVDSKIGLLVPNIKRVQDLSLLEIAVQMQDIIEQARAGRVAGEHLKGGTISISNIGAIGGITATPVINKPEAAIVALGKTQKLPRFDDEGNVSAQNIMAVNWSGDHRIIDGATMVRFNNLWMSYLTQPEKMLMHLK